MRVAKRMGHRGPDAEVRGAPSCAGGGCERGHISTDAAMRDTAECDRPRSLPSGGWRDSRPTRLRSEGRSDGLEVVRTATGRAPGDIMGACLDETARSPVMGRAVRLGRSAAASVASGCRGCLDRRLSILAKWHGGNEFMRRDRAAVEELYHLSCQVWEAERVGSPLENERWSSWARTASATHRVPSSRSCLRPSRVTAMQWRSCIRRLCPAGRGRPGIGSGMPAAAHTGSAITGESLPSPSYGREHA